MLLGSAAHDEAHFPDGDRFNLSRPGPQNLPFGHGIHFCLGAQLARMEGGWPWRRCWTPSVTCRPARSP
ncbi:cytochrome P450 [Corallococcus sp. 4LFB]|uniref:cytochrome P450 n=1 Tax=Corallococcus sp. 4LFB TaxID=3383249 RepID=UPI0039756A2C